MKFLQSIILIIFLLPNFLFAEDCCIKKNCLESFLNPNFENHISLKIFENKIRVIKFDDNIHLTNIEDTINCPEICIPNIFSPNKDQLNDTWCVLGGCFDIFQVMVVNQWGDILFYTDNVNECWNGLYKGELIPNGSYFYTIMGIDLNNQTINQKGIIQVNH